MTRESGRGRPTSARFCCFVGLVLFCVGASCGMDVPDFFPEIQGDLTKVSWAHAVNSQALLQESLQGDVMMLEADIVMGTLQGDPDLVVQPVMAHPPNITSDLSLDEFVRRVIGWDKKKKGIKLDFKSTEALTTSLGILKNYTQSLNFPVWLNADILKGPLNNTGNPVDAKTFLVTNARDFPSSLLSVGWTTTWGPLYTEGSYTEQHVQEMIQVLRSNNVTQSVTFPVRAGLAAHSLDNLQNLVSSVVNSTLTVWSSATDNVDVDQLRRVILSVGKDKVYVDVPEKLQGDLDLENSI